MYNQYMQKAIEQAQKAEKNADIPVGAVIVKKGEIIGAGFNSREAAQDDFLKFPTINHAEINALYNVFAKTGETLFPDCDLYVTLEPCLMCAGAIFAARLKRIYFGSYAFAANEKKGFFSALELHKKFSPKTEIYMGIMQEECDGLLNNFFINLRFHNLNN